MGKFYMAALFLAFVTSEGYAATPTHKTCNGHFQCSTSCDCNENKMASDAYCKRHNKVFTGNNCGCCHSSYD